jgi:3-oxoacyl-[acyl-carrier protein] reductase
MKLQGKSAIITGAGRGLGRADQIERWGGVSHIFHGDVSREDDVSRMVDETIKLYSTIDILVNNAAIIGPARFLEDTDFGTWNETISVNLNGPFYCARSVIPAMIGKGSGKVINISSGLGQMPFPRFCAYGVSKAGIIQLTRSLAEELKEQNIQVNAIDPGVMDTGMQDEIRKLSPSVLGDALHKNFHEYKESGSLKDPAEVATLAVFLASSSSDLLSGCTGTLKDYVRLGWEPEN